MYVCMHVCIDMYAMGSEPRPPGRLEILFGTLIYILGSHMNSWERGHCRNVIRVVSGDIQGILFET